MFHERILETYLSYAPKGIRSFIAAMPVWPKERMDRKGPRQFVITTGLIVAVVFGIFFPWLLEAGFVRRPWILCGILVFMGLVIPMALNPVYKMWMKLGLMMSRTRKYSKAVRRAIAVYNQAMDIIVESQKAIRPGTTRPRFGRGLAIAQQNTGASVWPFWLRWLLTPIHLLILVPVMANADVVIELNDGKRIVVPIAGSEVESIRFTTSGTREAQTSTSDSGQISVTTRGDGSFQPNTWRVGPGHALKTPGEAARRAQDGDTIEIEAGTYNNDYAKWRQSGITIRGIGGMAHLQSIGLIPNGKAIWILQGNNITIENVEFSGAAVRDGNGAGIRHQGGDLTLRNTFFHNNEFSVLSGKLPNSNIEVISSRFWFHKRNNRFSHGIYIGTAGRFSLIGCHFKGTNGGHHVKSRALENHVLYNRIEDVPGGNSSRLIDLPNCGLSFIIGNDLHQAATTENFTAIGYGHEGCQDRTQPQQRLFVVNNTFVNEARYGRLVDNRTDGEALVMNNLLFGRGRFLDGPGDTANNVRLDLAERVPHRWDAPPGSAAINAARSDFSAEAISLIPNLEFDPPIGTRARKKHGNLDVGSREAGP